MSVVPPPIPGTYHVELRKAHLKHEASLKSVGTLYYLGSAALTLVALSIAIGEKELLPRILIPVVLVALAFYQFKVAGWLRGLRRKARIPATVLSSLGLLGFPLGTLINGYILYLLHSEKGKVVLSKKYRDTVAATPEITYKTSVIVWILVSLLVLFLLLAALGALIVPR